MRVLVLSCNTGGGHNSAAYAIKDYFDAKGAECDIRDALAFISKSSSNLVSNGHVLLYKKSPKLFGAVYRFVENHPTRENDRSLIYDFLTLGAKALKEFLSKNQYDEIICTHVFAGMMATATKRKYISDLKIHLVATDYTCTPGTTEIDADSFFIPHKGLIYEYVLSGVPSAKIVPSGIPVRSRFYESIGQNTAKRMLNLPNKKIVLLMCGSMGCGPIEKLTHILERSLPDNAHLIVVCGSNRSLYKELTLGKAYNKTTVIGFTEKMHLYMSAADFALTKPGGLSSTEAFVKRLPLLLIDAVPGCETRNLEFFTEQGFAKTASSTEELARLVLEYLNNDELLNSVKTKLSEEFGCAPEAIYNHIVKGQSNEHSKLQETTV